MTIDSSSDPSLAEALDAILRNHSASLRVMLPGVVESYDASRQVADVKPLLPIPRDTGEDIFEEEIPVLPSVPVKFPRAGPFFMSLPLKKGHFVMLIFADRSYDRWWRGSGSKVDAPLLQHTHSEADAVALAGFYPDQDALSDAHPDHLVIGKDSGAQIHIKDDEINIYEENASDFAARSDRVDADLSAINNSLAELAGLFTSMAPTSNDGGASLKSTLITWSGAASLSGTASDKVKIT